MSPAAPQLQADSLPLSHQGSPTELYKYGQNGEFYIIYILPWKQKRKKEHQDSTVGTSLVVQRLRLHAPNAGARV